MPKFPRHRAFTLIELAVVVLVTGVIAAVAVPAYKDYINKARLTEGFQTLGSMTMSQRTYYLDHQQFFGVRINGTGAQGLGSFEKNAEWDAIGYPVSVNSVTYFAYGADAGQFGIDGSDFCGDGSSSSICNTSNTPLQAANNMLKTFGDVIVYPGSTTKQCKIDNIMPSQFGVNTSPGTKYDWIILMAKGNMTPGTGTNCTFIVRLLDAAPTNPGLMKAASGYIVFTSDQGLPSESPPIDGEPIDEEIKDEG